MSINSRTKTPDRPAAPRRINWKRNLFVIWIGQLLALSGVSFVLPFIPLYIRERFGIDDEAQLGAYVAAFNFFGMISFCISNPIWGALGDRFGRKLMLLRSFFLNAVTMPLLMAAPGIYWLIAFRAVISCFSGTVSAAQALVVSTTPEEKHGFALGVLSTALWSGSVLGLLCGGMIVHFFHYRAAFLTCGALYLVGGVLMLFGVDENFVPPKEIRADAGKKRETARTKGLFNAGLLMLLALLTLLALARRLDEPFLPMLVDKICGDGKAVLHTSFISACAAVGGILSGVLFGALSDRCPAYRLVLPALLVAGAATVMQSRAEAVTVLAVSRFITFFAVGAIEPVVLALISRITPTEHRGAALGWSSSARVLGGVLGAALGGAVVIRFRTRGVFLAGGVLMMLLGPASYLLIRKCFARAERTTQHSGGGSGAPGGASR